MSNFEKSFFSTNAKCQSIFHKEKENYVSDIFPKIARNGNDGNEKNAEKYVCLICDFKCSKKSNYENHLVTQKHKMVTKMPEKCLDEFRCEFCNGLYKYKSGLSRHKKKCHATKVSDDILSDTNNANDELKELVIKLMVNNNDKMNVLMQENNDLRTQLCKQNQQITELIPKITHNTINNINTNNKFNIQVFLNEQCKDAINFDDFIKSIKVNLQQLDYTKNNGLADGLTHIIMENIKNMNVYERPLHCTDIKRETLYIKNYNNWSKDVNNTNIKNAINKVSTKQYGALNNWVQENPDYATDDAKQYYYAKTLSIIGKPTGNIDNKIIKNLCNENHVKNILTK
jgi:hypothetical protein